MRLRRGSKGDVQWRLPGEARSFAYSTRATNDLIVMIAFEDGATVREARDTIKFDDDAVAILDKLCRAGYGSTRLSDLVR